MNRIKKQKRYITLIEIMIVMFLIALITGVIAYNYTGTLEEGKAFKTKTGMERLETILSLEAADNSEFFNDVEGNWKEVVRRSPLVKDPNALIKDGWGAEYEVTEENGEIIIRSERYEEYLKATPASKFRSN